MKGSLASLTRPLGYRTGTGRKENFRKMIRKDNELLLNSLLCRRLSGNFFKHFLIQTFQQPCDSGSDEDLKLREVQWFAKVTQSSQQVGVTKDKYTNGLFSEHWVVLRPIYVMNDSQWKGIAKVAPEHKGHLNVNCMK